MQEAALMADGVGHLAGTNRGWGEQRLSAGAIIHLPPQSHVPLTAMGGKNVCSPEGFRAFFASRNKQSPGGNVVLGAMFCFA